MESTNVGESTEKTKNSNESLAAMIEEEEEDEEPLLIYTA